MKLLRYIQSLLPRFERNTVEKNLQAIRKELNETIIPHYERAAELMANWKFKEQSNVKFDRTFGRKVKTRHRGNYVVVVNKLLPRYLDIVDATERLVSRYFSRDVMKSSLTYSRTQIIQVVEALDFAARYSRKLLIHTLSSETQMVRGGRLKALTPAEVKWLEQHADAYMTVLQSFDRSGREIEKMIQSIPDIEVDEENLEAVIQTSGLSKLDPLNLSIHGFRFNPIYHLGMVRAEWEVAKYEAAKEEKKLLEYEILDLQNMLDEKPDPKLEKAIEYTRGRVAKLNKKIVDMEGDADV